MQTLKTLSHQVMAQLELRLALARQHLLLKETDYRVKNSLQSIGSMLNVTASRSKNDDVRQALRQASDRVANVALLHQQLYLSEVNDAVDAAAYLQGVMALLKETMPPEIAISADCVPLSLNARQATAIGVIVTEFASNSVKHAFRDQPRLIAVRLERAANGLVTLPCSDDGPGMPVDMPRRNGLGLRIIGASAENLGGTLETRPGIKGHTVDITFVV